MAEHDPYHPFDYFGILVTRDHAKVLAAIKVMYDKTKKFENSNNPRFAEKYKRFQEYAALIASTTGAGVSTVNSEDVEQIVARCLPGFEEHIKSMARTHPDGTRSIDPTQEKSLKTSTAEKLYRLDRDIAEPFVTEVLRRNQIAISTDDPSKPPLLPVQNLDFECLDDGIQLTWQSPKFFDYLEVSRKDAQGKPLGTPEKVSGNSHLDSKVQPGESVEYTVRVSSGGSPPEMPKSIVAQARGRISSFKVIEQNKQAHLSWDPMPDAQGVVVLRSGQPLRDVIDKKGRLRISHPTDLRLELPPL